MRRTSFVPPRRPRPLRAAALAWALALALLAGAGWAFLDARRTGVEAARLETHAARLGTELGAMAADDGTVPTEAEFAALAARTARLNALSGPRAAPLPVLLQALETALPPAVRVGQFTYSAETGAFAVSLLGETETDLPTALRRVEAIPALREVILERQLRIQAGATTLLQYDIRGRAP